MCCADSLRTTRRWHSIQACCSRLQICFLQKPACCVAQQHCQSAECHLLCSALWQLVCCEWEAEHACPLLQNEHKEVKVDEILGRAEAEKAIKEAMVSPICALTLPSWSRLCCPALCQFAACLRCSCFIAHVCMTAGSVHRALCAQARQIELKMTGGGRGSGLDISGRLAADASALQWSSGELLTDAEHLPMLLAML